MRVDIPSRMPRELRKRAEREKKTVEELLAEILNKALDEEARAN